MAKKQLSLRQKKLDIDIWIITLITFGVFVLYAVMGNQLMAYVKEPKNPLLSRLLINSGVQFGIAGLGVAIVCILRKEKFSLFGLVKQNTLKSIIGSVVCFIPYLCYIFVSGQYEGYQLFDILIADAVLKSVFPTNILGMSLIVAVWGF